MCVGPASLCPTRWGHRGVLAWLAVFLGPELGGLKVRPTCLPGEPGLGAGAGPWGR